MASTVDRRGTGAAEWRNHGAAVDGDQNIWIAVLGPDTPPLGRRFRTKNELAWELIEQTEKDGVAFCWVGIDGAYGRDQVLLRQIVGKGKSFVADVEAHQQVWTECPEGSGRPENLETSGAQRVDALWEKPL